PEPQSFNIEIADKIILARNRKFVPGMKPAPPKPKPPKPTTDLPQKKQQLNGIVEVLFECHRLLDNFNKAGASIWFAGLTCAFGPVHNIPHIRNDWHLRHPTEVGFDKVSEEFNGNLLGIMASAGEGSEIVIVTLKKELVKPNFIDPLYARGRYGLYAKRDKWHLDKVLDDIEKFQQQVEGAANIHKYTIAYVDKMPKQAIVTERTRGLKRQTASVVIHVGTDNIGAGPATGYYSELPEDCDSLKKYVMELYKSVTSDG
ncbi:MAG: hypothetical protein JSV16_08205, partial [Candidatus Hydrogenedentota bacterium]